MHLTKSKSFAVAKVVEEMRAEQVAEPTEISIERQRSPQMNSRRPISSTSPRHTVLHWSCASAVKSSQTLGSTEEEKSVDRKRLHHPLILINFSQSTAQLQRHSSEQWHRHFHMRVTLNRTVIRKLVPNQLRRCPHKDTLRREN